jgi:hypothetical protein
VLYDQEDDLPCLSVGTPHSAVGDDVILRYGDPANEVVGVTLLGVRARLLDEHSDEG